jgi:hypothetical protein
MLRNAIRLNLQAGPRAGVQVLPLSGSGDDDMHWEGPDDDDTPTDEATFELFGDDGQPAKERVTINADAWRELDSTGSLDDLISDVTSGGSLIDALQAQLAEVENSYACPCGHAWQDTWTCACNDRCPSCNREIEPTSSTWRQELVPRITDGVFVLVRH